jgi:hypothetical protein
VWLPGHQGCHDLLKEAVVLSTSDAFLQGTTDSLCTLVCSMLRQTTGEPLGRVIL